MIIGATGSPEVSEALCLPPHAATRQAPAGTFHAMILRNLRDRPPGPSC
jgi:hypothetical protein